jgi:hypothetical protein
MYFLYKDSAFSLGRNPLARGSSLSELERFQTKGKNAFNLIMTLKF